MRLRFLIPTLGVLALSAAAPASAVPAAQAAPVAESVATEAASSPEPATTQVGDGLPERAAQPRTMRAYWHVFIAFAVTWLLLFGYALTVGRRFGRLEEELQRVASAPDPPRS